MSALKNFNKVLTRYMPYIVVATSLGALFAPNVFKVIKTSYLSYFLITVMLCMSLTLKAEDFKILVSRPKDVLLAALAQFTIMPFLAYILVRGFNLPLELAVGVVLVGTCPGGVSSNIITYLAKGDVPLSVASTSVSTLLAPLFTPLLTLLLIGERVNVNVAGMIISVVQIVIAPILIGLFISAKLPRVAKAFEDLLPGISVFSMMAMLAAIVAANASRLLGTAGLVIIVVVALHNILGYVLGYFLSKAASLPENGRIAISIEVGMQNTSLATTLAATHYASLPLATVPGAVFSIMHSITGALAASFFASRHNKKKVILSKPISQAE